MSKISRFEQSYPVGLSQPPAARLHFGAPGPSTACDRSLSYTEEGWRELYAMDPTSGDAPPAYQRVEEGLPPYPAKAPTVLNRRFFLFGFLCPLLWLAGTLHLFYVLLSAKPVKSKSWLGEKAQMQNFMQKKHARDAEVCWGLRCLWGFGIITCIVTTFVVVFHY